MKVKRERSKVKGSNKKSKVEWFEGLKIMLWVDAVLPGFVFFFFAKVRIDHNNNLS
jgi:hypothetical protein